MGTETLCACHTCSQFIELDKMDVWTWLNGEAISWTWGSDYFDTVAVEYELHHAWRLLRFIFLHQQNDCQIDIIKDGDEDHYFHVIKHYEEIDFTKDMNDAPWEPIWKRSQEHVARLNFECMVQKRKKIFAEEAF